MRIFYQRPLAFSAFIYLVCALTVIRIPYELHRSLFWLLLSISFFVGLIFLIRRHVGKWKIVVLLCLGAALLSVGSSLFLFRARYERLQTYVDTPCVAEGVVEERISSQSFYSALRVKITSFEGETLPFGAILEFEYPSELQIGDRFRVTAIPRAFTKDELFDEKTYRLSDGCFLAMRVASPTDCEPLRDESPSLTSIASKINLKQSFRLWSSVGMDSGGLSSGLLLGNRSFLSKLDQLHFRRAGISHLLALSGLHVSVLVAFLDRFLKLLHLSKTGRAIVIPLAAIGYLILTGCSVSAARAVLMACVLYLAFLFRHEYDSLTALCAALMLILTVTPYAVLDISLWLSFVAAGSIIIFYPAVNRFLAARKPKNKMLSFCLKPFVWVCTAVIVGFIANLALLPLSAAFFGSFSVWSIPATVIFSLPVTLLMIGGVILLVCPYVPFLAEGCAVLESFILDGAAFFSERDICLLPLSDTRTLWILAILTAVICLFAVVKLRRAVWALLLPLLFVAVAGSAFYTMRFPEKTEWQETTVMEDHRGKICVYTGDGSVAVVNDTYGAVSYAYEIKSVADSVHSTEIDDVILQNPSNQAAYFLTMLSEAIRVRRLHLPLPNTEEEIAVAEKLLEVADTYGISVYTDADKMAEHYYMIK